MLCIYPEQQKAFFYSVNTDGEGADYARLDRLMTKALNLAPQAVPAAFAPAPDIRSWSGHYVPVVSGITLERYTDVLMEGVTLDLSGERPVLHPDIGAPRQLAFAGGRLLRASDRSVPSHAVLRDAQGRRVLTNGLQWFREMSAGLVWALRASLAVGLAGLAYLVVATPFSAWKGRRSLLQPAAVAPLLLLSAGALVSWHGFERFGDFTVGSASLFAATILLPIGVLVQAVRAARGRYPFWKIEVAACVAVLQWCLVLAFFGLLPLALWI